MAQNTCTCDLEAEDLLQLCLTILSKGNNVRFKVHGNSMYPFIRNGDIIEIEPAEAPKINLGEIIFYHSSNRIVAHRLIKRINSDGEVTFVTKGDSRVKYDKPLKNESIMGKVVMIQSRNRTIWLNQPSGKAINYLAMFYSLASSETSQIINYLTKKLGLRRISKVELYDRFTFLTNSIFNILCAILHLNGFREETRLVLELDTSDTISA